MLFYLFIYRCIIIVEQNRNEIVFLTILENEREIDRSTHLKHRSSATKEFLCCLTYRVRLWAYK